jgi:O-antigen/teichoic acid export membrane protein
MLVALMFLGMRSIDRIIIATLLNSEMLGYFSVGTIVSGLIYFSIGDVVSIVFSPRIMEKIGGSDGFSSIKPFLIEPTVLISYVLPLLIGSIFFCVKLPIIYFLPEYTPAIIVIRILCTGAFFISISIIPLFLCIAINKQIVVVVMVFFSGFTNALLSYFLITFGFGISGVAIGTNIAYY